MGYPPTRVRNSSRTEFRWSNWHVFQLFDHISNSVSIINPMLKSVASILYQVASGSLNIEATWHNIEATAYTMFRYGPLPRATGLCFFVQQGGCSEKVEPCSPSTPGRHGHGDRVWPFRAGDFRFGLTVPPIIWDCLAVNLVRG